MRVGASDTVKIDSTTDSARGKFHRLAGHGYGGQIYSVRGRGQSQTSQGQRLFAAVVTQEAVVTNFGEPWRQDMK